MKHFEQTIGWLLAALLALALPLHAQGQGHKRYHGDGIDDVLRLVPSVSVFALKAAGVQGESTWGRRVTVSVASMAINAGLTYGLKKAVRRTRPDGTDDGSFPSGHTSVAFCGAMTLHHEYGRRHPWVSVAGFAVATAVGVDRVRRNRHHWEDVAAGAAIGVLSAEAGHLLGNLVVGKKKGKKENVDLAISPVGASLSVSF